MTGLRKVSLTWFNQYFHRILLFKKRADRSQETVFFNRVFSVQGKMERLTFQLILYKEEKINPCQHKSFSVFH